MSFRVKLLLAVLVMFALMLSGCGGGEEEATGDYEDGVYFAQAEEFSEESGWKDVVVLEVEDNQITMVEWNAAHRDNGTSKYVRSQNGEYGMVAHGNAMAPWYEQADAAEEWLLENQDIGELELDDEGRADAITGASIHVNGFKQLVEEALSEGPAGYGPYQDGSYTAEADEFGENGWKPRVSVTVIGGRIVAAQWDETNQEGQSKDQLSKDGEYGMVANSDATLFWHEQANAAEAWLLGSQDPSALDLNDQGRADAISGATITVAAFKELAQKALEGHER
jgi:major membrane immunogen (membrane-anchored lipoprotein)